MARQKKRRSSARKRFQVKRQRMVTFDTDSISAGFELHAEPVSLHRQESEATYPLLSSTNKMTWVLKILYMKHFFLLYCFLVRWTESDPILRCRMHSSCSCKSDRRRPRGGQRREPNSPGFFTLDSLLELSISLWFDFDSKRSSGNDEKAIYMSKQIEKGNKEQNEINWSGAYLSLVCTCGQIDW